MPIRAPSACMISESSRAERVETITKLFFVAKVQDFERDKEGRGGRTWLKYADED